MLSFVHITTTRHELKCRSNCEDCFKKKLQKLIISHKNIKKRKESLTITFLVAYILKLICLLQSIHYKNYIEYIVTC